MAIAENQERRHDVITIVAMFTIVAINQLSQHQPQLSQKTTIVAMPTTIVAILLNHNCRNANHKCRNFFEFLYILFKYQFCIIMAFYLVFYDPCIASYHSHNNSRLSRTVKAHFVTTAHYATARAFRNKFSAHFLTTRIS